MKEKLEKELKKQKTVIILAILGLIFSILYVVLCFNQKDFTFWAFVGISIIDIIELPKYFKQYKEIKSELEKNS